MPSRRPAFVACCQIGIAIGVGGKGQLHIPTIERSYTGVVRPYLLLLLVAGCCFAQQRNPGDTVDRYVRLRLGSAPWVDFAGLISWDDEPGWDCNWVSNRYTSGLAESKNGAVIIPVTYHRLGFYCHDFDFKLEKRTDIIRYEVVKSSGGWKIKAPEPEYPDVSADVLITQLQIAARDVRETAEHRKQAEALVRQLSDLIGLKK